MAEMYEASERTERATKRRREEMRARGHVARSAELTAAMVMLGGLAGVYFLGGGLVGALERLLEEYLGGAAWLSIGPGDVTRELGAIAGGLAGGVLGVLGVAVVVAMGINVVQVGFLYTGRPVRPDFNRLNPLVGLRRIFSARGLVRLVGGLLKVGVVAGVVGWVIAVEAGVVSRLSELSVEQAVAYAGHLVGSVGLKVGLALVVLGVLDYGFERFEYERALRMTREELREELRETEGDPRVRARRRQVWREGRGSKEDGGDEEIGE